MVETIDVEAFHHLLKHMADRNGAVTFTQKMMRKHLGVSAWKMSTLIDEMVEKGMVERVNKKSTSPTMLKIC